jgi:hypothetical protein
MVTKRNAPAAKIITQVSNGPHVPSSSVPPHGDPGPVCAYSKTVLSINITSAEQKIFIRISILNYNFTKLQLPAILLSLLITSDININRKPVIDDIF